MSVHDTKIQDFTNVLKQFYVKVKALIPTKVSQLTNDKGYKTTDTTYTNFVKSGSGAKAGLVPAPPTTAGTSKYLREDGTWQAAPGAVTPVNNLLATTAGKPLDAVQGKVLNDKIDGVNSSLKANNNQIYMDYHDGKYGINTDPNRGADTFLPFRSGVKATDINIISKTDTILGSGTYTTTEIPTVDSLACISVAGGGGSNSIGAPTITGGEKVANNIYKVKAGNKLTISVPKSHSGSAWGILHIAIVFVPI